MSTKSVTSKVLPGWSGMQLVMEWSAFQKTLLKTLSSFRLEMVRQFWARFFTGEHVGKLKTTAHQISELVDFQEGIKFSFIMLRMNRTQIHLVSLWLVSFPLCSLVYLGCCKNSETVFLRMLKTGIQYLLVNFMRTLSQEYLASLWVNCFKSLKKEGKQAGLCSVSLFVSVIPVQA